MIEATSCGGVVIFRGKILLLYKNYKNKYEVPGPVWHPIMGDSISLFVIHEGLSRFTSCSR